MTQNTSHDQEPARSEMILVVDDEEAVRELCVAAVQDAGFEACSAGSAREALELLETSKVDIVLSDLKMPGMDGIDLLRQLRRLEHDADAIIMTAHATIPTAVEATKLGAFDFVTKPFAIDDLLATIERLAERRRLTVDQRLLEERAEGGNGLGQLIGNSPAMQQTYRILLKVAPKHCPVLITGESGSGKELVARAIHAYSPWKDRPFVPVDCGALTPTLIESELFGHVRGAFTGATQDRPGLFRTAADGTIFLDEIGELPLELQAKLLRVLQESEFRAVGSDVRIPLKARVVAATNRNLEEAVREKQFRGDLFYRLNVISLKLPPLRNRKDDISGLAQHFVARYGDATGAGGVAPEALDCLLRHDWPGNVRELENCMRRALALADGPLIGVEDLPPELWTSSAAPQAMTPIQDLERRAIVDALQTTRGHRANAAKLLGMGKTTLYSKLKEYGIEATPR
jgi:two-component system response regulator HydG